MLPSKQQWQNYSALEKWGLISAVATLFGLLFAIYMYFVPPTTPLTVSDKVVKDDNPTELQIAQIKLQHWVGDSEPYVTVAIKNISKRTALSVVPSFLGEDKEWEFSPTKTSSLYQNGIAISAQETTEFPIAPVSEFLRKIQLRCPSCYLAAIGMEANIPDSLTAEVCEQLLNKNGSCQFSGLSTPVPISIRYKTIFDETAQQTIFAFAYLSRNIPTSHQLPIP